MSSDNGGGFLNGFLIGGLVGAVVGILLAPKPGSETRSDLIEQSEMWRDRAEELAVQLRERIGPTVEIMRDRVAQEVKETKDATARKTKGTKTRSKHPNTQPSDTNSQTNNT